MASKSGIKSEKIADCVSINEVYIFFGSENGAIV
jgi:hypothetical protein